MTASGAELNSRGRGGSDCKNASGDVMDWMRVGRGGSDC